MSNWHDDDVISSIDLLVESPITIHSSPSHLSFDHSFKKNLSLITIASVSMDSTELH